MLSILDHLLVALLVTVSGLFVTYSFASPQTRKWLLSQVARVFGLRVLLWVLPKQCACTGCSVASSNKPKLAIKLPTNKL